MAKSKTRSLIIFIKNPELGKCKTRLAATVGNDLALQVYLNLLSHTRNTALKVDTARHVFYDQHIVVNDDWDNEQFIKHTQAKGDLGQRMENAFLTVLEYSQKAIIIGSDCPEISPNIINQAFEALDKFELVIGPTHDGGYYLLGMNCNNSCLFRNMIWSTSSVFETTITKIEAEGKSFFVLKKLSDLDNEEDLEKFPSFKHS